MTKQEYRLKRSRHPTPYENFHFLKSPEAEAFTKYNTTLKKKEPMNSKNERYCTGGRASVEDTERRRAEVYTQMKVR